MCRSAPTSAAWFAAEKRSWIIAAKKLGIGHKQTTPDGMFSLEEVECIGACSWAPAVQVNYDFHENLTPGEDGQGFGRVQKEGNAVDFVIW